MARTTTVNQSSSALPALGILFIALKLTNVINWSWWWVLAPFWGGAALIIAILVLVIPVACVAAYLADKSKR